MRDNFPRISPMPVVPFLLEGSETLIPRQARLQVVDLKPRVRTVLQRVPLQSELS